MTNHSLITADRTTHLKIVVVALLASVAVMVVGIAARPQTDAGNPRLIVKAGPSLLATSATNIDIR